MSKYRINLIAFIFLLLGNQVLFSMEPKDTPNTKSLRSFCMRNGIKIIETPLNSYDTLQETIISKIDVDLEKDASNDRDALQEKIVSELAETLLGKGGLTSENLHKLVRKVVGIPYNRMRAEAELSNQAIQMTEDHLKENAELELPELQENIFAALNDASLSKKGLKEKRIHEITDDAVNTVYTHFQQDKTSKEESIKNEDLPKGKLPFEEEQEIFKEKDFAKTVLNKTHLKPDSAANTPVTQSLVRFAQRHNLNFSATVYETTDGVMSAICEKIDADPTKEKTIDFQEQLDRIYEELKDDFVGTGNFTVKLTKRLFRKVLLDKYESTRAAKEADNLEKINRIRNNQHKIKESKTNVSEDKVPSTPIIDPAKNQKLITWLGTALAAAAVAYLANYYMSHTHKTDNAIIA